MKRKRVVIISDLHSGSAVGLTHPDWDGDRREPLYHKLYLARREYWKFYRDTIKSLLPIDILIVNGDCLEGKGEKSGGIELIEADRQEQCKMAEAAIEECGKPDVYMTSGCFTAGHRILTSDLRYVPVESLRLGDRLLAFDENGDAIGKERRWRESIVTLNAPFEADVFEIKLSDGTRLVTTGNHPFLMRRGGRPYEWWTVEHLYKISRFHWKHGHHPREGEHTQHIPMLFPRFFPVWETLRTYEAGYLSGFFDSEGSLCQSPKKRIRKNTEEHEATFRIDAVQRSNPTLDATLKYLYDMGMPVTVAAHDRRHNNETMTICVTGGLAQKLRLLGSVRPPRLLSKFDIGKLGFIRKPKDGTRIIDIQPAGKQIVWGLGTSTGTYVCEGFLSHNTPYHTGVTEELERGIADQVKAIKFGRHDWLSVNGLVFDYRHFISGSQIPYGRHTAGARDRAWNVFWNEDNVYPKSDIIIRSHVHYFSFEGGANWMAVTTPALQGKGTKFGAEKMSGTVNFGLLSFDVTSKKDWSWSRHILKFKPQKPLLAR